MIELSSKWCKKFYRNYERERNTLISIFKKLENIVNIYAEDAYYKNEKIVFFIILMGNHLTVYILSRYRHKHRLNHILKAQWYWREWGVYMQVKMDFNSTCINILLHDQILQINKRERRAYTLISYHFIKKKQKKFCSENEGHSVVSDSLWPYGLYSLWNSPGQDTGVDSLFLLQWIFPTQWWVHINRRLIYIYFYI